MTTDLIDSNTWYTLSEYRVNATSNLLVTGSSVFMSKYSQTDPARNWQLLPLADNTYQIRNRAEGIINQLSTCYVPAEADSSKTQPCMKKASGDDAQKWRIFPWGDGDGLNGSFYFENVANGSNYRMDCHPGDPLFMNAEFSDSSLVPAQHWIFSSIGVVNDLAYSSTVTTIPTSTQQPTNSSPAITTDTSSTQTSPTNTSTEPVAEASATSSSELSSTAKIGIGLGLGLGAAIILLLLILYILHRKKQAQKATPVPAYYPYQEGIGYGIGHEYAEMAGHEKHSPAEIHTAESPQELEGGQLNTARSPMTHERYS